MHEAVGALLAAKAQPAARDADGKAPLHLAAAHGVADVLRVLLAARPAVDVDGEAKALTPLHLCAAADHAHRAAEDRPMATRLRTDCATDDRPITT